MLCDLETLVGARVVTRDGAEKRLRNFLFDDRSWSVRFLVIDVGTWLGRHLVVVPTTLVSVPDCGRHIVATQLTADQLLMSPDADSQMPVARQQELAMNKEFGWSKYGFNWFIASSLVPAQMEFLAQAEGDPHLRGTLDLIGYKVRAVDGPVGLLEDFVLEPGSWQIKYLIVKVGDWVFRREHFVPTGKVTEISWANHSVTLADACGIDREQPRTRNWAAG